MFKALFRQVDVPQKYRANFFHLYLDIGWFGVLSGSAVNFLNVYAARLGATGFQIGLIGAMSAIVNLAVAIPAGRWLEKRSIHKAVFWVSVFYRIGFLFWALIPFWFNPQGQIAGFILLAFLMGIPLTALSVGFNALFAEAVPVDWRAHVAGIRNVVLSVAFMASALGSGYLLDRFDFPINYQIVFLIGFIGAAMSSVHLYFVKPLNAPAIDPTAPAPGALPDQPPPRRDWRAILRIDIWKTPFRTTLLVMLGFHAAQFLAIPLFPLYMVNKLGLTDQNIGIGTSLFYLTVLIGSTQLARLVARAGHKQVTGWGVAGLSLYPILLSLSSNAIHFYALSILGGLIWSLAGGAYANYLIENVPENDRPAHFAWYNIVLNAAILFGSLAGPFVADQIGLGAALLAFGVLRALAGIAILKWG
jgi:MFS family permease